MVQPPSSNSLNLVSALNDGLQCSLEEVYIKNSFKNNFNADSYV